MLVSVVFIIKPWPLLLRLVKLAEEQASTHSRYAQKLTGWYIFNSGQGPSQRGLSRFCAVIEHFHSRAAEFTDISDIWRKKNARN
jgi:hypothetical protein